MHDMPLAPGWCFAFFVFAGNSEVIQITLVEKTTNRTKVFILRGHSAGTFDHMLTLTDTQCDDFWPKKKEKKGKKK